MKNIAVIEFERIQGLYLSHGIQEPDIDVFFETLERYNSELYDRKLSLEFTVAEFMGPIRKAASDQERKP